MTKNVYLAGPVQHADDHGVGWRETIKEEYPEQFNWLDPLDAYNSAEAVQTEWTDDRIVEKDLSMIDDSDALLVNWREIPTCGTPMEVFYAFRIKNIPVVTRYTGDEISPWMGVHSTLVVEDFDMAMKALMKSISFEEQLPIDERDEVRYASENDIQEIQEARQ